MKPTKMALMLKWLPILGSVIYIFSACTKVKIPFPHGKPFPVINVSSVSQLYDAVNNSANTGQQIVLAPGTYILSADYPNAGRLELQNGMALTGQTSDAEKVIIDESELPAASFAIPSAKTGGIRMGRGFNMIEYLTVKGNINALSVIDTDLPSDTAIVRIGHVIVRGGQIGIDVRNRLAEDAGRTIEADIEDNEVAGDTSGFGTGIAIQNANGATGGIIQATLKNNYAHGNRVGFRAFNNAAGLSVNNGSITIESEGERYEGNGLGMYVNAGISQATTAFANGNVLSIVIRGSSIRNNNPVPMPPELMPKEIGLPAGGIYAVGGLSIVAPGTTSNNKFTLSFFGTNISNNHGTDINAFGAEAANNGAVDPSGANNTLVINLNGISKLANVVATPSLPAEAAGTNVVNIIR